MAVGLDVVSRPTTANIGDVTEVRLEGRGPTTDQTFVLVDRKGAPVRGVEVRIAARNAVEREWVFDWSVTGTDGVAVARGFPALADWPLTVEILDGKRSMGIFPYSPEGATTTLTVGGEVRLIIRALDAFGVPVLGADVRVRDAASGDTDPERIRIDPKDPDLTRVNNESVTDRNGGVRWAPLPCGPYVLEVEHTGYKSLKRTLDLTEPGERLIEVTLTR